MNSLDLVLRPEDTRGYCSMIKDFLDASCKEIVSRSQRRSNPLRLNARQLFPSLSPHIDAYDISTLPWQHDRSSTKLVVLIHGLNSSPLAWTNYLHRLANEGTSYFAPYVKDKCYCKLKKAADPILEVVQDYAEQYPRNPIYLVGHSIGARIAAYIEQKLSAREIYLISIAGPHHGSHFVNLMIATRLSSLLGFTPEMEKELSYQGEWSTKKIKKWQENARADVTRLFFASPDDWRSSPIETSFPNLPNSQYVTVTGESHVTIIDAVCQSVLIYINNP